MNRLTVIITGATKGLGRATALAAARTGHQVIGLYAHDDEAAGQLRKDLSARGSDSLVLKHDVCSDDTTVWDHPGIQQATRLVFIHNATAPFTPQPFHLLAWEDFESNVNVALKGGWSGARALLRPMLRAGRGTIVNVLTTALHHLPPKGFAAYVSAKHALRGLTLALAAEYSAKGVRVFSVSPGFMATPLTANWDARLIEAIHATTPPTDPDVAARRILELVENDATPGRGEDHAV